MFKLISTGLGAMLLLAAAMTDAQAVTCANGVYRAGCAGPNGAAVARKPVPAVPPPRGAVVVPPPRTAVVVPAPRCTMVNGVRVCR